MLFGKCTCQQFNIDAVGIKNPQSTQKTKKGH